MNDLSAFVALRGAMGEAFRRHLRPLAASFILIAVLAAIASLPGCDFVAFSLLPGALAAALLFPQGIESDHGFVFLALAGLIDVVIFSFPLGFAWRRLGKFKKRRSDSQTETEILP
jgi:hypothetical protein